MRPIPAPLATLCLLAAALLTATPASLCDGDLRHWDTWLARPADAPKDATPLGLNHDPRGAFSVVDVDGRRVLKAVAAEKPVGSGKTSNWCAGWIAPRTG